MKLGAAMPNSPFDPNNTRSLYNIPLAARQEIGNKAKRECEAAKEAAKG